MSTKTDSYSTRLINLYAKWGDTVSIQNVEALMKEEETLANLESLRQNPHTKLLIDSAIQRWRACMVKLTTQKKMSDAEREATFIDMDWAQWYLNSLGGNVAQARAQIEKTLEERLSEMEEYEKAHGTHGR